MSKNGMSPSQLKGKGTSQWKMNGNPKPPFQRKRYMHIQQIYENMFNLISSQGNVSQDYMGFVPG